MKNSILISLFVLLGTLPAQAQLQVGIKAGYLYDKPVVNTQYAYTRQYHPGSGAVLAAPVQYDFLEWFGLVIEPQLQFRQTDYYLRDWHSERQKNLLLDFPILANFSWGGEKVRGFVNIGGYLGGWLDSWSSKKDSFESSDIAEETGKRKFSKDDNRFDGGLTGGIGLRWFNDRKVSMSLEYRYYYGLTSYRKTHADGSSYGFYNNLQTVTLGVHFCKLCKKSK